MQLDKIVVIGRREYLSRIRTKGFWLSTIALPIFMGGVGLVPALLLTKTAVEQHLVVVDAVGGLGELLAEEMEERADRAIKLASFTTDVETGQVDALSQRARLDARILAGEIDAWVWIDAEGLENDTVEYHAESVSNFVTQSLLESSLSSVIRGYRLRQAGYDAEEIGELVKSVSLTTIRVTEEGSREEQAATGIALAYILFFLLYMVLILYGQQVMNGVLEEKGSRIVEVIIASTRPFDLMMGKIAGICLVALTQLTIWIATIVVLTLPGVVSGIAWLPKDSLPTFSATLLIHFFLHFLIGFFLFSTFYATVGAAFNNLQEAQQFASTLAVLFVAPALLFWMILNDPDSTVSVVTSLIPVFTPLLMLLRIAVKEPPLWQILLGYALTTTFTILMVSLCARIYRVGILMYGKKPTLAELWRWIRYA